MVSFDLPPKCSAFYMVTIFFYIKPKIGFVLLLGAKGNVPGGEPLLLRCNVGRIGVTGAAACWVGRR